MPRLDDVLPEMSPRNETRRVRIRLLERKGAGNQGIDDRKRDHCHQDDEDRVNQEFRSCPCDHCLTSPSVHGLARGHPQLNDCRDRYHDKDDERLG